MQKRWLRIIAFILAINFLVLPATDLRASDCWYTHMTRQMSDCSYAHNDCSWACVSIQDSEDAISCFDSCSAIADSCRSQASADYGACIDAESAKDYTDTAAGTLIEDEEPVDDVSADEEPIDIEDDQSQDQETKDDLEPEEEQEDKPVEDPIEPEAEDTEVDQQKDDIDSDEEPETDFDASDAKEEPAGTPEESESKPALQDEREVVEWMKGALEIYTNAKDLETFFEKGKFDAYSRASLAMDLGNGFITLMDELNKGTSFEDALAKATIDTAASAAFMLLPPLKAAEILATMPDAILKTLGFDDNSSVRAATKYVAEHSPSAFVKATTSAMIKTGSWDNVAGALSIAANDVRDAQGFGATVRETGNLIGTAVGAVPVAGAMVVRDGVDYVVTGVKVIFGGIAGWFTGEDDVADNPYGLQP